MSVALRNKGAKKHFRCVVCGSGFSSEYDDLLKAYPVYHSPDEKAPDCEHNFFSSLLRLYLFIHKNSQSVTSNTLVNDAKWVEPVQYRKELIGWCINVGYFTMDDFNRLMVPTEISATCENLFCDEILSDPEKRREAVEMLIAALEFLKKKVLLQQRDEINLQDAEEPTKKPVMMEPQKRPGENKQAARGMFTADSLTNRLGGRSSNLRVAKAR
ncbi:MAG: hypothetical protein P9L94_03065 [Candidatus Hinthialibacter antarcticus]|nr:hypothetical protein [Candidatus Hinthialibacter antarcticus]